MRNGSNHPSVLSLLAAESEDHRTFVPPRLTRRVWLAGISCGLLALAKGKTSLAAGDPNEPDASAESLAEAERAIPFDAIDAEARAKVLAVVDRPSLYRRLPLQTVDCDHDMHLFLIRYPEVVVNIWKLMGISNIAVKRIAPFTVDADDGGGTVSRVELVYGDEKTHVYFCQGYYEGPLFKRKLTGKSVVLLRSKYGQDRNRRPLVADQVDVFLQIENVGAELIAKTLHSTVGKTVDANFAETARFLTKISQSAERNGNGMHALSEKLTSCEPPIRNEFGSLCLDVNARAAERMAAMLGNTQQAVPASASVPTKRR